MATIGIAFGNSTSSIAFVREDGKVDVIADPDGDRFIDSALSYVGSKEYHGAQAIGQLIRNSDNTVVNFRDFIGVPFDKIDATYSEHSAMPINVDGKVGYEINGERITVDEIAKRHLKHIAKDAEDYLGEKIEGVVMTVPFDFTKEQKELLTKISGEAGLHVLQLIHEPSSALLAHLSAKEELLDDKVYVVADFGGVRSDAAVIAVRGGIFTVLSAEQTSKIGGSELDSALMDFCAKDFKKKFKTDATTTDRSYAKLHAACLISKKTLSNVESAPVSVDSLAGGLDYHTSINRMRFEVVARNVFSQMAAFVEDVIKKAGLETLDIDSVLLSGGSSNIPKIARNMEFIFPETTTIIAPSLDSKLQNPNELNCRGAALQASLISSFDADEIRQSQEPDVISTKQLSQPIGVKGANGEFITLLPKNTVYPIKKVISLEASADDVLVELYEGKRTVKETVEEPEKDEEDEEDEDDEEDEPDIIREVVYVPSKLLGQLALKGAGKGKKVDVIINIRKEGKVQLTARAGSAVAKGVIV
ncbi:DEKNAAC105596 [Brettanomyces naardenensis]|uniref:DEKNAAC105596 n=1 Tax=Brettanomyces naardenensis TaxID=13370 RepID=A0A448YU07_BRENA|nr:DEKNAAC105596 [Brettanomyces naardenensis]